MFATTVQQQIAAVGKTILWFHAGHCPYRVDAPRPQECAKQPIANCPVCKGTGMVYDGPRTIVGIIRGAVPKSTHHKAGVLLEADGTILCPPLPDPVFQVVKGKINLADIFLHHNVAYAVMAPPDPPEFANELLCWRFPIKRVAIPVSLEDFAAV